MKRIASFLLFTFTVIPLLSPSIANSGKPCGNCLSVSQIPGYQFSWAASFGGAVGHDYTRDVDVDIIGNTYITGDIVTTDRKADIFIAKRNPDGTSAWSKTIGGNCNDHGNSVAADNFGNIYVTGQYANIYEGRYSICSPDPVDFDPGEGIDSKTSSGYYSLYITKFYDDGSYGWTKTFSGESIHGAALELDIQGNIYITGTFEGTVDFDPGPSTDYQTTPTTTTTSPGGTVSYSTPPKGFITKINSDGSYGWTNVVSADTKAITVDSNGNIYTTGGGGSIFVIKTYPDGSPAWTKSMGGESTDAGLGITTDSTGNIYVSGHFGYTMDFDPGEGVDIHPAQSNMGIPDAFLTKINADGSYGWTKVIGGPNFNKAFSVAIDGNGNIFLTGYAGSETDFDPGSGEAIYNAVAGPIGDPYPTPAVDIFILKLNPEGTYSGVKRLGSMKEDAGLSIALDHTGSYYVSGYFMATLPIYKGGVHVDTLAGYKTSSGEYLRHGFVMKHEKLPESTSGGGGKGGKKGGSTDSTDSTDTTDGSGSDGSTKGGGGGRPTR